jgi:hypothetical protein
MRKMGEFHFRPRKTVRDHITVSAAAIASRGEARH